MRRGNDIASQGLGRDAWAGEARPLAEDAEPLAWYAVMTAAQSEPVVEREAAKLSLCAWYPCLLRRYRTRKGCMAERIQPAFPRYVFVGLPGSAIEVTRGLAAVARIRHVSALLQFDGEPARIPSGVMAEMMSRCDAAGLVVETGKPARSTFPGQVGQRVRMSAASPFSGLVAHIASLDRIDSRSEIGLWLEALGGRLRMTVPVDLVGEILE